MDERVKKFEELIKDSEFLKGLLSQKTPEEAQAFLEAHGIEATMDEVKGLGELIAKLHSGEITVDQLMKAKNGELSEDELEEIAGGTAIVTLGMGFTVSVGGLIATAVGTGSLTAGTIWAVKHWDEVTDFASSAWDTITSW